MHVAQVGVTAPATAAAVRRWVRTVLAGEQVADAVISVTFLSAAAMRRLNRAALGRSELTDVIAYPLPHPGRPAGDIYVSPAAARRSASKRGIALREELRRVVVHGVLHTLGFDHPDGEARTGSAMWRRQERYVRAAGGGRSG